MRKRTLEKLRSRSGETLAEVLVALLIIALSSMLLVVMYNTAASIDLRTRARDKVFYADLTRAETRPGSDAPDAGATGSTIKIVDVTGGTDSLLQTFPVTTYGGNGLVSYQKID